MKTMCRDSTRAFVVASAANGLVAYALMSLTGTGAVGGHIFLFTGIFALAILFLWPDIRARFSIEARANRDQRSP